MTPIKIKALVAATPEKTWDCYTNPEHIVNWNFAIDTWCCPHAENDMRVGGTYKARMEAKDGSFGFDYEGVYTAIDPGKSMSYGLDNRMVHIAMEANDGGTLVEVTFDPEDQNPLDMQEQGWQMILNNFKAYTEQV